MTFEIKTIELSCDKLNYHVGGAGTPVLYLHAAGGVMLTEPLKALTKSHTVYAPICPGFDGTEGDERLKTVQDWAAMVAEFAEKVIGPRFDVIGSSFGSWTALWLAANNPKMVDHLILQVPAGFRFGGKGGLPADPEARFKALYAHPQKITSAPKSPEVMAANGNTYERLANNVQVDEALSARLPSIEAVTLILLGTEDKVVPAEAGAYLKRMIPTSQRAFIFDAAHSIEVDQPERTLRLWTAFLKRGPGYVLNQGPEAA
ncbi:pimeloyl-ACP methyl ester carboxylesterase [Rhizobium petrolearium]|uniref:alpha/beta fold hydrolase n=1 Tax=Neorhizobium petrolearium TaxID=515361 RepID=UPI001AE96C31|nr:alpha/beta hydrolase [Neorhizobium petrolearium]MBP1844039.1 pimeloyl-ACP methyl ester carboxylesterase [Neorhizobium petrolearium]